MDAKDELNKRLLLLKSEKALIETALQTIELTEQRARYKCHCVALNEDFGIVDLSEQIQQGRVGLTLGLVPHTLSALKECPSCHGTGIPESKEPTEESSTDQVSGEVSQRMFLRLFDLYVAALEAPITSQLAVKTLWEETKRARAAIPKDELDSSTKQ